MGLEKKFGRFGAFIGIKVNQIIGAASQSRKFTWCNERRVIIRVRRRPGSSSFWDSVSSTRQGRWTSPDPPGF